MSRLQSLKIREVIKRLKKAGFIKWRQSGSHAAFYRATDNRTVTIPIHFGRDVPKGTLRAIIKQAGLTVEEFEKLR